MVLGKLPVPGRPAGLDSDRVRAYCACGGCGWFFFFFLDDCAPVYHFSSFSLSGRRPDICDRLWDFGPYGGTWAKLGFLHNLTCSYVLGILVNF